MTAPLGRRGLYLALALALSGCGFQPVYMPTATNKPGVAQRDLSAVFVEIIPERPGQLLRQALQERFADDSGTPAAYNLHVVFTISGEGVAIETNSIATRIRLIGNASWTLLDHDAKHTALTSGSARAFDAFNIFDSQYFAADLESEAEQKRLADTIASQITTQLAVWFRQQAAKTASKG
jgi:LPS-assembly lipoprotein